MSRFKIYIIPALILSFSTIVKGQVGIGTVNPHPSTALDISSEDKGFLGPRIALTSRTDIVTIPNPVDGLVVFNTTVLPGTEANELKPSYYVWYQDSWRAYKYGEKLFVTRDGKRRNLLGYEPNGIANATSFTMPSSGNGRPAIVYTGLSCKKFNTGIGANNHTYCTFKLNIDRPQWQEAFEAAKSRGGYLVTITTPQEWNFILNNILKNNNTQLIDSSIWIGYNKVNFSGNPTEFAWITGETSQISWNNSSSTFHNFRGDEPNNQGGNEGCVHIMRSSDGGSGRQWNDINCDNPYYSAPYNHIIIEFDN